MIYFDSSHTCAILLPLRVGEWLSLVEHLVRDQGVGGSNPLSPTILSLDLPIVYAASAPLVFSVNLGTFGTTGYISNPNPLFSAHSLRNSTSSLILSYRSSIE